MSVKTAMGFEQLNKKVASALRKWAIGAGQRILAGNKDKNNTDNTILRVVIVMSVKTVMGLEHLNKRAASAPRKLAIGAGQRTSQHGNILHC
jgi:hypothetical protein